MLMSSYYTIVVCSDLFRSGTTFNLCAPNSLILLAQCLISYFPDERMITALIGDMLCVWAYFSISNT